MTKPVKSLVFSPKKPLLVMPRGYYVANFMALVVLMDAYCTCAGIDARAAAWWGRVLLGTLGVAL